MNKTMEEKIKQILKKRMTSLMMNELISPFFWDDFANEIAKLFEDMYPKAFVEWLFSFNNFNIELVNSIHNKNTIKNCLFKTTDTIVDEVFKHWQTNIEGK